MDDPNPSTPGLRDDELFADALELPVGARTELLDRVCAGDPARRARLEALLAAHAGAGGFLEEGPAGVPRRIEERIGDVLGRYRLEQKLGEGGCGAVYLAEQQAPVRRRVALKVIKLGMDTRAVIARFEAERQALALMDHPDIARVFDAGATDAGRPYFVMEYVEGIPITRFCDEHALPVRARLELFARVCLALQHAHQKGVIHRDVKPSNILVALVDGVPAPKVIDFGIAKATQDRLTDRTLVTAVGQFIGTPAYMSPEQVDQRDVDVDIRSDVYALGVLLYELLAGRLPLEPGTLTQGGLDSFRRLAREGAVVRPSAKVAALAAAEQADVARGRSTTPRALVAALRGDLDWITARCLEKDPDRRYGTARELAADVLRHVRREPVEARPPGALYRVERFVARNRLACASAAAVLAALLAGTGVSVWQAVRATRAEGVAVAARQTEAQARRDAQRRQEQAEDLLTFMLGDFHAELKKVGRLQLLDAVGEKAMTYFAGLKPQDLTDTALTRQAKALTQIGEVRLDENRLAEAEAAFAAAQARAAALAGRHPQNADMIFERGQAEFWIAAVARKRGALPVALEWIGRYRDTATALMAVEGRSRRARLELSYAHDNLAVLAFELGKLEEARRGFESEKTETEALLAETPDDRALRARLAEVSSWLGSVAEREGRYQDALASYREMQTGYAALARAEPGVARWQIRLAESMTFGGIALAILERRDAAVEAFAQSERTLQELVTKDPKNRRWQTYLLNLRLEQAAVQRARGDAAVLATLVKTRTQLQELATAEPSSRTIARCLGVAWQLEAALQFAAGDAGAAAVAVARATEIGDGQIDQQRANTRILAEAAQSHLLAGRIAAAVGDRDGARRHWERVLAVLESRLDASRDGRVLDPAAQALVLLGRTPEARPLLSRLRETGYHSTDPLAEPTLGSVAPATGDYRKQ
ncbi:serine/threonine-protein kinase [Opitutus sp. ER46]|uniref:serine/threonine-protein kinase n=1 Tax=Opitutus sp. ER46 TaxID=2161864 RepID=UPI000D30F518|nr:serine/threonine-protein kinase [Opitutus sp. ER46]PTX90638.1 hypothetical protein DB354_18375 [Opitutus sp. ER46]